MSDVYEGDRIYSGGKGSGKSYNAVVDMINALDEGRRVVTNVAIYPKRIAYYIANMWHHKIRYRSWDSIHRFARKIYNNIYLLKEDEIQKFYLYGSVNNDYIGNRLFVLDELHLYFNARNTMKVSELLCDYLSQSRKLNDNILILTQNINNLDIQFRRQCRHYYHWHDSHQVSFFKWKQLFTFNPLPRFFLAREYYGGEKRNVHVGNIIRRPSKSIFALYETKALHNSRIVDQLQARMTMERLNIEASKLLGQNNTPGASQAVSYAPIEHYFETE